MEGSSSRARCRARLLPLLAQMGLYMRTRPRQDKGAGVGIAGAGPRGRSQAAAGLSHTTSLRRSGHRDQRSPIGGDTAEVEGEGRRKVARQSGTGTREVGSSNRLSKEGVSRKGNAVDDEGSGVEGVGGPGDGVGGVGRGAAMPKTKCLSGLRLQCLNKRESGAKLICYDEYSSSSGNAELMVPI